MRYAHLASATSVNRPGAILQNRYSRTAMSNRRNCAEVNMLKWPTHEAYKVTPKGTVTVTNITCVNTFAAEYELSE